MIIEISIGLWMLIGVWSFVKTQDIINGWSYIRKQKHPHAYFFSAMIAGPITTLGCFYTLYKFYRRKK